jgi:hypothetical protein
MANPSAEPEGRLVLAASAPAAISATVVIITVVITTVTTATTYPIRMSRIPRAT